MRSFKERIEKIRDRSKGRSSSKAPTNEDTGPTASVSPAPAPAPAPATTHAPVTEPEPEQQTKVVPAATPEIKPDRNFWQEAFEILRVKDWDLCNRYIEILQSDSNCGAGASGTNTSSYVAVDFNKLLAFANKNITALEQKSQWSKNCELIARALGATKDLVSLVPDPYSSVAAAGLSVLLPKSLLDGLKQLPLLLKRAKVYGKQLHEAVLPLYVAVLDFVIRAVYHNNRALFSQIARDVVRANNWASLVQEMMTRDEDCQSTCSLTNNLSVATNTCIIENKLDQFLAEKKNQKLLDIHKAFSFGYRTQKNINPARAHGTCDWFLSHPTFMDWQVSESPILWVYADPGTGKSTLSKALVDESLLVPSATMAKVCYFFFKDDGMNNHICPALLSILHQLFNQDLRLVEHARTTFDTEKGFQNDPEMLWPILEDVIADPDIGDIVILLDALDECNLNDREQLTEHVRKITQNKRNVRFLLTSRPYTEVRRSVVYMSERVIKIAGDSQDNVKKISKEIEQVIRSRIETEIKIKLELTEEKKELLLQALLAVPNTTYLWVHFIFSELKTWSGGTMEDDLREFVAKLPRNLTEHYRSMLAKSTDQIRACWTLKTVLAAKRPLSISELKDARGEGGRTDDEFRRLTKDACGMTVIFHKQRAFLLHQSVKDFLIESSAQDVNGSPWSISLQQAELHLANVCAEYLYKFELRKANWMELEAYYYRDSIPITTFANYAGRFWLSHVRNAGEDNIDPASIDNVIILRKRTAFIATSLWSLKYRSFGIEYEDVSLHLFCDLGLLKSLKRHLEKLGRDDRLQIKATHPMYRSYTPLHLAARGGYTDIVKLLLGRPKGLEAVKMATHYNLTPLHIAVERGHLEVLKELLETSEGIETLGMMNNYRCTPLHTAATVGYVDVVERILKTPQGLETIKMMDKNRETPLHIAAGKGHQGIVKHILETSQGLEAVETIQGERRTPLHLAAASLQETEKADAGVVKLLLSTAQGLKTVKIADKDDNTPLHLAASNGHKNAIRLLIGTLQGLESIAMLNKNRATPLYLAAKSSYPDTVKLLLSTTHGCETVKIADKDGFAPLHRAAYYGHRNIVRLLVETPQGLESVRMLNNNGETPLYLAAKSNYPDTVKLLLSTTHGFGAIKIADNDGFTPLHVAAYYGCEKVVRLLTETPQGLESVRRLDNKGQAPLRLAAAAGKVDTVKQLLSTAQGLEAVKIADKDGDTPLHRAAYWGYKDIVQLLIGTPRGLESAGMLNNEGQTPLEVARSRSREAVVKLLESLDQQSDMAEQVVMST